MSSKKLKKAVVLNEEIINIICKEYKALKGKVMHLENYNCFSDPDYNRHVCNYTMKINGHGCNYCHHNPMLWSECANVCQISKVCMAAYLLRMEWGDDIAGLNLSEKIEKVLTLDYEEIITVIDGVIDTMNGSPENRRKVLSLGDIIKGKRGGDLEDIPVPVPEWLPINKANEILGWTVQALYDYMKAEGENCRLSTKSQDRYPGQRGRSKLLVNVSDCLALLEELNQKQEDD
jgi:hypothetical protein